MLWVVKVMDPDEAPTVAASGGRKPGDMHNTMQTLKSAVVATIAPEHQSFGGSNAGGGGGGGVNSGAAAGHRLRSSIMRSGMYSDRMDIG